MEATLQALPQLQHLRCSYASSRYVADVARLPRALTRLHSLQRFWWDIPAEDPSLGLPDPQGMWLWGLRSLALNSGTIMANQAQLLAATPHLESLDVLCTSNVFLRSITNPRPVLQFAMRHASLRRVHLCMQGAAEADHSRAASAIEWARQQRPDMVFTASTTPLFGFGPVFDHDGEDS